MNPQPFLPSFPAANSSACIACSRIDPLCSTTDLRMNCRDSSCLFWAEGRERGRRLLKPFLGSPTSRFRARCLSSLAVFSHPGRWASKSNWSRIICVCSSTAFMTSPWSKVLTSITSEHIESESLVHACLKNVMYRSEVPFTFPAKCQNLLKRESSRCISGQNGDHQRVPLLAAPQLMAELYIVDLPTTINILICHIPH